MTATTYHLDHQIGFLLRRAHQRHTALFAERMGRELTPTQFAAIARLHEFGPSSQNLLGRDIAVDAATIKGVVDRLGARGLVAVAPDQRDQRRVTVSLTPAGEQLAERCIPIALEISDATLAPVAREDRAALLGLLADLADGVPDTSEEATA
jgi:MarR family transcriptional regulator, lower aerobic nicotinate degradation pathway regulator